MDILNVKLNSSEFAVRTGILGVLSRGVNEFMEGYEGKRNLIQNEKGDRSVCRFPHCFKYPSKNRLSANESVYMGLTMLGILKHRAETLVLEHSAFGVGVGIELA
jgi:hypothetical protein